MAQNSTNRVSVTEEANNVAAYTWSPQCDYVTVSNIPAGGTTLTLPADPTTGDEYGFMTDSSIGPSNPVTVQAGAGASLQFILSGHGGLTWAGLVGSAKFRFDASVTESGAGNWSVVESVGLQESGINSTAVASLEPGTTQGPAASVSFSAPAFKTLTGKTKITAVVSVQCSAAGTGVTFSLHNGATTNPALGPSPVVGSSTDTNHQVTCTLCWIDGAGVGSTNTYVIEAVASTGTVTAVAGQSCVVLENV
jgi:hypothetical protein